MKYLLLFYAILKKDLTYQWRYKVNAIVGVLFLTFVCFGIIFGIDSFSDKGMDASEKAGFIGGYILWIVMMTNYQTITRTIRSESALGTFEQLYINTPNMFTYLFLKCFSGFINSLVVLYTVILVILLIADIPLDTGILMILPTILIGIPALWGISLGIGSLGLVLKQIDSISSIISMIVLASIPVVVQKSLLASIILPFGLSNKISQDIFTGKISLANIGLDNIGMIIANDIVYVTIGVTMYKISEYYAKKYGKLAHH